MRIKITEQLVTEIDKHKDKIDDLKYGQLVFIIHQGNITRGQIVENFEPADKPVSGKIKKVSTSINPAAGG